MGKRILKFGLMFLLLGLVVVFTTLTILVFVAPAQMAKTFENLNMKHLAYGCYDRQYRNSDKVDEQYVMLIKAEEISFDSHVVYYAEKLFNNREYEILIAKIDGDNIAKADKYIEDNSSLSDNEKIRLKILSRNEDNYLTNCYVKALMTLDKDEKAKNFVTKQINDMIENNRFGADTSFSGMSYIEDAKILPTDLLLLLEDFATKFENKIVYDEDSISIDNMVSFQRFVEISTTLGTHYKNVGNENKSSQWLLKAQQYLNLIYC